MREFEREFLELQCEVRELLGKENFVLVGLAAQSKYAISSPIAEQNNDELVVQRFRSLMANPALFRDFSDITSPEDLVKFRQRIGASFKKQTPITDSDG